MSSRVRKGMLAVALLAAIAAARAPAPPAAAAAPLLVALDPRTGAVAGADMLDGATGRWLGGRPTSNGGPYATIVVGDEIIGGGVFDTLGGARRDDLGGFSATTGAVAPWAPVTGPHEIVETIGRWNDRVVAALAPDHWDAGARRIAAFSLATGARIWSSPLVLRGSVNVIASDARTVLVGT
jgi:hypothetical protein